RTTTTTRTSIRRNRCQLSVARCPGFLLLPYAMGHVVGRGSAALHASVDRAPRDWHRQLTSDQALVVDPLHALHLGHIAELVHQGAQVLGIVDVCHHLALEDAVLALEADAAHVHVVLVTDDGGDAVHQAHGIDAAELDAGQELHAVLAFPACLHDAHGEIAHQLHGVGAVHAVDADALAGGDEAEDVVARDGVAVG